MSFDKEWEVNSSYVHFFEDDGIYRMYYIAWDKEKFVSQTSDADDKKLRCCYAESKDGLNWTKPERINFGESEDIPLYTNCVSKYERAPHMYIGFPTRYMERKEWTKSFDVLSGREERIKRMKTLSKREGLAITDCAFMCSRDGRNFKRYDEAFFKAGPEYGYNWVYGDCYPAKGLTTKSKFDGADDELSMLNCEYTSTCEVLRRYTLRMDSFTSVHAGATEKVLVTKAFIFEGNRLFANMATSACGYMHFEIADKEGNLASSCEMFGNSTDKLIGFEKDLSAFAGKEVVMTVRMCDADLYAIRFLKE